MLENNNFENREKILSKLEGIKRTTGQHPGGLLIIPKGMNILDYTPLNYPANNSIEWPTTHFDYNHLSKIFLKMDMLGHDEPTVLHELQSITKFKIKNISFRDKKVMDIFTNADVLGIPEFGTTFNKRNFLIPMKPKKFSDLVQISGLSHGTDVWMNNQQDLFKIRDENSDLNELELISCREDLWNDLLPKYGINKEDAFMATEIIRKGGKWESISQRIRDEMEEKLKKTHLMIIKKIKYLFPKPHAIAYTINAWRVAYYKVYFPKEFYSVLLTHHVSIYDAWLMSLEGGIIRFRIKDLVNNINVYKNAEKELFSMIRVIKELNKDLRREAAELFISFQKIIEDFEKKRIGEMSDEAFYRYRKSMNIWKMTTRESDLLFSLKIIKEIKSKGIDLRKGFDLNKSDEENFKIENDTMFFPLSSISKVGKKTSEEIIEYRKSGKKITRNWRKELKNIINSNQMNELSKLEINNLIIWDDIDQNEEFSQNL